MTFEECELSILRNAVDHIEDKQGKKKLSDPEIKKIIEIVENFLKSTKRMCYGGTAINNLLPKNDQFYNKDVELPDYDFFSPDPVRDAKNLANIYFKHGYEEVEAKEDMSGLISPLQCKRRRDSERMRRKSYNPGRDRL